jgi:Protein of unknown function (DUF1592)/Protein of unknown function (DUF1588)/Protein of unknown function (DUF1587)/Protein of unknown function (DUF1585)/Protein of unknown function (DUF1595)/Planctomycete cytochrome C
MERDHSGLKTGFLAWMLVCVFMLSAMAQTASESVAEFQKDVRPLLENYCYDCHGGDEKKGDVSFEELKSNSDILNHDLWFRVLKNLRAGLMPPAKRTARPSLEERQRIEGWIKYQAFAINPQNPDPGRVTIRRLNRAEYRNTVRDLMGVDFDTEEEFPADDTGYGFDDIGEVLTMSPMLLEKYLAAAETIVTKAVPTTSKIVVERIIPGRRFHDTNSPADNYTQGGLSLSYKTATAVANTFKAEHAGRYELEIVLTLNERYVDNKFDYNKCRVIFKADGQELLNKDYARESSKPFHYKINRDWQAGEHELTFELQPLTPDAPSVRSLTLRIDSVTVRGPYDEKYFIPTKNYTRFFPRNVPVPGNKAARRAYAEELLRAFATKAFRRPADDDTVKRLADLAAETYTKPGHTFESGIAHAMIAVMASPRFLFREDVTEPVSPTNVNPFIDEYSLASRLSYFLWSSMPDDELMQLAGAGSLRKNLTAQVNRMLADPRSEALVDNFTGQWLQARDISTVPIDARSVLAGDAKTTDEEKQQLRSEKPPRIELDGEVRQSMKAEVDKYFDYVMRQNRDAIELVDSDYTFLNERLAKFYGLTNLDVKGSETRKVTLPPDCPRGGILTMGGVLAVTSNPTRTSPVKRGLFILDNILGVPPPPPPPNIPPLEDAAKSINGHTPTLRETLAIHRQSPLCSSCHNRLDPPGLALENFNAMGMWRESQFSQPIDSTGKLITGESFTNVIELKHILAAKHRDDFYHTLTEKMLTYALGRGLEYYDVETVDQIVSNLKKNDGHISALLTGIIESSPFQKSRKQDTVSTDIAPISPTAQVAGLKN